jgi:hypothetical protein
MLYTPFKWKYAHLSAYGRGAWEIAYRGDAMNSNGFFGSAGVKAAFLPMKPNFFRYRAFVVTVFSEYTTRHELRTRVRIKCRAFHSYAGP